MDPEAHADEIKSPIEDEVRALFRQGKYGEAVPFIQSHLASHADDVPAYELMADALRFSGDKAGAAGALATASELYARDGHVILSIAAQKRVMKLGVEPDYTIARTARNAGKARIQTPLFDDLSDEEFHETADLLEHKSYEAGEVAVAEGGPGDAMFVVASGRLVVTTKAPQGDVELGELGPGDFFGEAALLSGRPRTATVRAAAPTQCLVLSKPSLDALVARCPRVRNVMEEFNRRRAENAVEHLVRKKR